MADDLDSVLSGVKDAAQAQNAAPAPSPPVDAPPQQAAPIDPALKGVLQSVKDTAHAAPEPPRSNADLDKEIADYKKQKSAYDEAQKPSELGEVAKAILPGNPFTNLTDPEGKVKEANDFFHSTITGRIADAMGHAVIEDVAAGTTALLQPVSSHGVTKKEEDEFPVNGEDKWQNTINQVVRLGIGTAGVAYTLQDAFMSLTSTPFSAAAAGAQQAAEESGSESAKREIGFLTQPEIMGEVFTSHGQHPLLSTEALREFFTKPPLPLEVSRAVDNGIVTPSDPSLKAEAAQTVVAVARAQRLEAQKGLVSTEVTPGLHDIVRQDNPELFKNYDTLTAQHEQARAAIHQDPEVAGKEYDDKLTALKEQRAANLRVPIDLEGEELDAAVKKSQERDAEIAAQIKELGNRNRYIADSKTEAQQRFLDLDNQLRDISPQVNAAYAEAAPKAKEAAFAVPEPKPFTEEPQSAATEASPATEAPKFDIAADVKKKLSSEGRTKEQADAESKLIAARYETAAANGWAKGTAAEIYQRHMAEVKATKGAKQGAKELEQSQRGNILLASKNSGKAIIKLFKKNDASTLMHEMAHHWLDEMVGWEKETGAPEGLKTHMDAVRKWLGADTGEFSGFTSAQHEKWARGFESYLREGVAPSKELANAFAHFKQWLTQIYKTVAKLKVDVSPEIKNVFDHMLAVNPERIALTEERAVHEKPTEGVTDSAAQPADNAATGGTQRPDAGGKEVHVEPAAVAGHGGEGETAKAESVPERAGTTPENGGSSKSTGESGRVEGEEKPIRSKATSELVDKAGNIVLKNLTTDQEIIAGLKVMAEKTPHLDHAVVGDVQVGELARELGIKNPDSVIDKLQGLASDNGLPLAAYVRAMRDMLANASQEVREFSAKVKGGTTADFQAAMVAKDRFMLIAATVSKTANEIGRALRAFQDISGATKSDEELHEILQQSGGSKEEMEKLFQTIATKDTEALKSQVPKILQAMDKSGFWKTAAEYRRCSILSNYITHALWLAGTGVNLGYKALVLDTLGGLHNSIGMLLGRKDTGSRIYGGVEGLYQTITKALPNILSATGTALTTGKTVLRPHEGEFDTYLATGGIRKTLNIDVGELKKAVEAAFKPSDHPELVDLQTKIDEATAKGEDAKAVSLQAKYKAIADTHIKDLAQTIAARMQSRLKTWGDLMGEMHDFGVSAAAAVASVGKSIVSPDFYKDKKLLEAKTGEGQFVPDIHVKGLNVLPVGTVMRGTSGRIYSTMHTFAREVAANIETVQHARRIAIGEGKEGEDIHTRMAELMAAPTKEMMQGAQAVNTTANKQTLMSNESDFAKWVTKTRSNFDTMTGTKIGSFLFPVVGIPAEAVHQTVVESSPVGLLSAKERGALSGGQGALAQERAQVKMIAGTALLGLGAWLYGKGVTTPSASVNYNQEQERRDAGKQSGSIRAGDWMLSLAHTPVIGTLVTTGADLAHIYAVYKGEDISDKLSPAIQSTVNNFFLKENALSELADLMDMARGKTSIGNYMKNMAVSTLVPQFIKATDDLVDPKVRESKSFMSAVLSKIPGESDALPAKVNALTGEPLIKEPFHNASAIPDPVAQQLMAIHRYPANPHPEINKVPLTAQQLAEYSAFKGHILHNGLQDLMQGDGKADFDAADVEGKQKMVDKRSLYASQCAKSLMFSRYPELLKDANDKYEASCAAETE